MPNVQRARPAGSSAGRYVASTDPSALHIDVTESHKFDLASDKFFC